MNTTGAIESQRAVRPARFIRAFRQLAIASLLVVLCSAVGCASRQLQRGAVEASGHGLVLSVYPYWQDDGTVIARFSVMNRGDHACLFRTEPPPEARWLEPDGWPRDSYCEIPLSLRQVYVLLPKVGPRWDRYFLAGMEYSVTHALGASEPGAHKDRTGTFEMNVTVLQPSKDDWIKQEVTLRCDATIQMAPPASTTRASTAQAADVEAITKVYVAVEVGVDRGRWEDVLPLLTGDPAAIDGLRILTESKRAKRKYHDAQDAKFGVIDRDWAAVVERGARLDLEQMRFEGDRAVIPGSPYGSMRRVGSEWRMEPFPLDGLLLAMEQAAIPIYIEFAAAVKRGAFDESSAASAALRWRLMALSLEVWAAYAKSSTVPSTQPVGR